MLTRQGTDWKKKLVYQGNLFFIIGQYKDFVRIYILYSASTGTTSHSFVYGDGN